MGASDQFRPVTRAEPCVICGKGDWCRRSASGGHECHRVDEPVVNGLTRVATTKAGFGVYRESNSRESVVPSTPSRRGNQLRVFASVRAAAEAAAGYRGGAVEHLYEWTPDWHRVRIRLPKGKTFCEITRTDGGWIQKGPKQPHPLYREAELPANGVVYVVEGEKSCDAAWVLGLPTVTSGSCSSARSAKWDALRGRDVVILPDHDEAGETYATQAIEILHALHPPARIRVVRLNGLPERGDLVDFVEARDSRTTEEVVAEIEALVAITRDAELDAISPESDKHGVQPVVIDLSDVHAKPIDWCWDGRIAYGSLTMFGGLPASGKGFVSRHLAARKSAGLGWPDSPEARQEAGNVVLIACEDDVERVIKPHFERERADCSRVKVVPILKRRDGREVLIDLGEHLSAISAVLDQVRPSLLIIDPVNAYLGGRNTNDAAAVYAVLAPLARLAAVKNVAVILNHHLNKTRRASALERQMGSVSFTAAVRSSFFVMADPDDDTKCKRLFVHGKSSLCPRQAGLRFEIESPGFVSWSPDPVQLDADELFERDAMCSTQNVGRGKPTEDAKKFLAAELSNGPKLSRDIEEKAQAEGHAPATLKRARRELGVRATEKRDEHGKVVGWQISLNTHDTDDAS